jgi:hypothetical protein
MLSSMLRQARSLIKCITTILKRLTMAKITTYPNDTNITSGDKLIGTDVDNSDATKNFTVGGLQSFFGQTFVPYTGATQNVNLGTFNLNTTGDGAFGDLAVTSLADVGVLKANFGIQLPQGALEVGATNDAGSTGEVLVSQGAGVAPSWSPSPWLIPTGASFFDTTVQSPNPLQAPTKMKFNTTDISSATISIVNDSVSIIQPMPSRIFIADTGVFNIQFSAQLQKTAGGGTDKVSIWLRKNGVDVPNSTTHVTMTNNNDYNVAAWNFFASATTGFPNYDYFEIMWASLTGATLLNYETADLIPPHPAVPSVILTVNKVA